MENRIFRNIGIGIVGVLVLLFILPAILRLLIVGAVIGLIYKFVRGRSFRRAARYRYYMKQNGAGEEYSPNREGNVFGTLVLPDNYLNIHQQEKENWNRAEPVVIKIG